MNTRASKTPRNPWRAWIILAGLIPSGASWAQEIAAVPAARAAADAPGDRQATPGTQPDARAARDPFEARCAAAMTAAADDRPTPRAATGGSADLLNTLDLDVRAAGCATCGGYHAPADGPAFHAPMGCADGNCTPGRGPCYVPEHLGSCTMIGEFARNLFQCLCCPDPCYQPRWVPAANASLFADYARPRTITRFRYDNLNNMNFPDRNQYYLQSLPVNFKSPFILRGKQYRSNPGARIQQISLYQEVAGDAGSFFIETPYRQINPTFSPTQAGFSDLNFGVKSLLFDCEMLQVAFQFRTYMPTGNAGAALGTGHVSLEPSLLASLKLGDDTYFQAQVGNWIPLGGNQKVAGGMLFWFMSLNQVIYRCTPTSPLIATLEMDGWSFENGGYTRPVVTAGVPAVKADGGGVSYFNIGPGLRQSICDKVDIGTAITFPTTSAHWASPFFRFEVRFLF